MAHQYSKLGSSNLFGPDCQKCNITTLVSTEGQKRRKESHEEGREGEREQKEIWGEVVMKTGIMASAVARNCYQVAYIHSVMS